MRQKYFEWTVADDYPDSALSLRFQHDQIYEGRELTTVDFLQPFSSASRPVLVFTLNPDSTTDPDLLRNFQGAIHSAAGILIPAPLSNNLQSVADGSIQWIQVIIYTGFQAIERYSLLIPRRVVDALDLQRTSTIPMPGGARLPIPPYYYRLEELNGLRIARVQLAGVVIDDSIRSVLEATAGFAAVECT